MTKDTVISIKISEALKEALRVEAFNRRKTISALIRDMIVKELQQMKEKK